MKNKNLSFACPNCQSTNIEFHKIPTSEEQNEEELSYVKIRKNSYECQCKECGHKYKIDYGYEKQYTFQNPSPINYLNNAKVFSVYMSDSPFEKNYKIISLETKKEKEEVYLLLIEGEEIPVLLSKDSLNELLNGPEKAHTLIKKKQQNQIQETKFF